MTAATYAEGRAAAAPAGGVALWPVLLAGFGVWVLAILANAPLKLDHDEAYFLASGRVLNEGARLYTDWIDFNTTGPSSIGRFSAWLASLIGAPLDLTHKGVIFALALTGLAVAFAVLLPELRKPGAPRWILAIGLPAALLFATPEFGRREQMLCIGALGWAASIVLAARNVHRPWPILAAAGVAAGLTLYEKPHFILFAVVLGLVDLMRAGWRPGRLLLSTWVAAAVSVSLYLWLVLANPDFLGVVYPATVDLYGTLARGWDHAAAELARTASVRALAIGLAAGALFYGAASRPGWTAIAAALAFSAAASLLYIQQGFGFEYHRLPLDIAFNIVCVGLLAWGLPRIGASPRRAIHLAGLAAAGLLLVGAFGSQLSYMARFPKRDSISEGALLAAMRPPHAGDPILIITTDVHPASEVLTLLDARWSSPFISHFPIPALIRQDGRDGRLSPLPEDKRAYWTSWFMAKVSAGLCADPPVRVGVEITEYPTFFQKPGFDMLAWLREDPKYDACWRAANLSPVGAPVTEDGYTFQIYAAN